MNAMVSDWLSWLRSAGGVTAIPLLIVGAGLMIFGWRLWKVCVVLSFALMGAIAVHVLTGSRDDEWHLMALGAVMVGALSYIPAKYAVGLLGGTIGAVIVVQFLDGMKMNGPSLWIIGAITLFGCSAFAWLNRRLVVIFVTGFLGSVLLVSGLTMVMMSSNALYGTFRSMAASSCIVVPFMLLVPTVMSCFYQASEVRRLQAEF